MLLGSRNLCVEVIFQVAIILTIYLCYYLDKFLSYMARIIYSWSSQSKIQDLILMKGLPGSGNWITLKSEHTCWSSRPELRWGKCCMREKLSWSYIICLTKLSKSLSRPYGKQLVRLQKNTQNITKRRKNTLSP